MTFTQQILNSIDDLAAALNTAGADLTWYISWEKLSSGKVLLVLGEPAP